MKQTRPHVVAAKLTAAEINAAMCEALEGSFFPTKRVRTQLWVQLLRWQNLQTYLSGHAARFMLARKRDYLESHGLVPAAPAPRAPKRSSRSTHQPKAGITVEPRRRGRTQRRGATGGVPC